MPYTAALMQRPPGQQMHASAASKPHASEAAEHEKGSAKSASSSAGGPAEVDLMAGDIQLLSQHLQKARRCHQHVMAAEAESAAEHPKAAQHSFQQLGQDNTRCVWDLLTPAEDH